jgi:putative ABC transport system permease protein
MHLRYAFRQLRKNPGFACTAVLMLAIGIGAATAIFSLVYAVLLAPLPFPQPEQLMSLKQQDHSLPGVAPEPLSYPDYFDWRAQNHTFSGLASWADNTVTLQRDGESQRLDATEVSSNIFDVLGTAPMLGRSFRWDEEKPGNRAVMLSYSLWRTAFGSSKGIVGRSIALGDLSYIVVGVMPESFHFPIENPGPAMWVSIANSAAGKEPTTAQRGNDHLEVIGRLKPGVTPDQAKADLGLIAANLARQYPNENKWYTSALVEPELDYIAGDTRPALRVLLGAVALVLLLACANVAGLLLARGSRRGSEFALRSAVGASRGEIIRQLLTESVVLSFCGGAAGVALASALLKGIVRLVPLDVPRINQVSVNGPVLVFAVGLSVLTGLLFGLLPAWQTSLVAPAQTLREGARTLSTGRWQHRLHSSLVIAQTAIGLVLLVGSGLLIRSFIRVLHVDPGFDAKHVFTARVGVPFDSYSHDQHFRFYEQLLPKLVSLPGVQVASAGWPLPLANSHASVSFSIVGQPVAPGDHPSETIGAVMPDYFKAMRIPLLSGRMFNAQDGLQGAPVIIINQAFAKKYFPGENPIGQHIQADLGDDSFNHPVREVVGVVGDIRQHSLTLSPPPQYFLPYAQAVITNPFLTIRTSADPASMERELRAAVQSIDKNVPVYAVSTLEDYVSKSEAQPRFQALLLTCFAGIALLLSAIGLYGMLSYVVAQRSFEIGLRMAIGAQRGDVLGMILRRGLTLTCAGLVAGLAGAAVLTSFLAHLLYGVKPLDPLTFTAVSLILLAVSALASFVPALRAAQLDPVQTLRDQ